MKTRTGFVSNSSSSSFIISSAHSKPIPTTKEVAALMLRIIKDSYKDWGHKVDWYKSAVKDLGAIKDPYQPIEIPWSCNYETYIWFNAAGDCPSICVDTCNNHDWTGLEEAFNVEWLGDYGFYGNSDYDRPTEPFIQLGR